MPEPGFKRPMYGVALKHCRVLELLAAFDPHVVGTLPLGVEQPDSDIDIVCCAIDLEAFAAALWRHFGEAHRFGCHQWIDEPRPVVAHFETLGWPVEIFGSPQPVQHQAGWRHFEVERRLLAFGGNALRTRVLALRGAGLKTEPAFATVLELPGDPYEALLELYELPEKALRLRLEKWIHAVRGEKWRARRDSNS